MLGRLLGIAAILMAVVPPAGPAVAEIAWDYVKPGSERSAGEWLSDILGMSEFGRSYAVIIGLSRFEHFNPLDATENDPQRVFDFLRDEAGFDYILMLRDEEVTYQALRNLFEFELPRTLQSNDRFLLFWSGHGTQFPDWQGVELGYLPLVSSPLDNKATMVNMADLARWDNDLPAKQALFLLDACFSGLAGMAAQSDDKDLEIRELAKPGHHIISAGRSDEQTIASRQEWQGSIFTHALLQALRGKADRYGGKGAGDGVINLHELVADMGETVKHAKAAAGWNRPLRPVLNVFPGRGEGQFFFLTNEKKRSYLETQGLRVGDRMAYGMPIAMGPAQRPTAAAVDPYGGRDVAVFGIIKDSPIAKDFGDFIGQFPDSAFAPYARNRLALLRQREAATPPPPVTARIDPATEERGLNLRPEDRSVVQQALTALGFDPGGADGIFGANTRRAIIGWQRGRGDEPTGYLSATQYGQLLAEAEPKLATLAAARQKPEQAAPVEPAVGIYQFKPGEEFRDCEDCPLMVVVPAGSFTMGSTEGDENERPPHPVMLPAFAIGKYEVTFDDWEVCVGDGGCDGYNPSDEGWGRGRLPVIHVHWGDAKAYVDWLSKFTGKRYRLPSEAEWEFVARAGREAAYWWGGSEPVPEQANFGRNVDRTTEVGAYPANPWGLHDMNGNVWEWVEDCWHDSYEGAPEDGSAWTSGDCRRRVARGGSWNDYPGRLRSTSRDSNFNLNRLYKLGFRVARTLSPSDSVTP